MNIKVAIADDNKKIRDIVKKTILSTGKADTVLTAENGEEMIDIIHTYLPDIIITDIIMPIKHGIDVIKSAKQIKNYYPTIIALSEISSKEYIDMCFSEGADFYITKPINTDDLKNLILLIKERRRSVAHG